MKCTNCNDGKMKKQAIEYTLEITGGPVLKIKDVQALVCPKCGEEQMDLLVSADITKKALAALVLKHSDGTPLRGKTARWIYKETHFDPKEWEQFGGYSYDAFSKAVQRNSEVDRLATLVLLAKTIDFINGSKAASKRLQSIFDLEQLLPAKIREQADVKYPKSAIA